MQDDNDHANANNNDDAAQLHYLGLSLVKSATTP